jgi:uncharacterized protein
MDCLQQFTDQKFLNLETFRKNGEGMKTPVWFTQEGRTLYVRTVDGSGKVKRVHNNSRVNVAPCAVDGKLLGEWVPAQAQHVHDPVVDNKVASLIRKKYGLMGMILAFRSRFRHNAYAILEIRLVE